jgi:hypothetical protein
MEETYLAHSPAMAPAVAPVTTVIAADDDE